MKKYIIAGCIIILLGLFSVINAFVDKDLSDILFGISFIIVGLIYFAKKDYK